MKRFILIFCSVFINGLITFAINKNSIILTKDSLPLNLNNQAHWLYNQNDSGVFKYPVYNDSKWKTVKSTLNFNELGKSDFIGLAWFRINLKVDSTLKGIPLAMQIKQSGASEIYIDGKLLKKFGVISTPYKSTYYDPQELPLVFTFNDAGYHLIAIKYANYHAEQNFKLHDQPEAGFEMRIGSAQKAIENREVNLVAISTIFMILAGFFFSFSLIHFFMFLLNRTIKSNLYFSVFMLCLTLVVIMGLVLLVSNDVDLQLNISYVFSASSVISLLALSGFVNHLFSKSKRRFFLFLFIGFIVLLLQYFQFIYYFELKLIFIVILLLEGIYLVSKAILNKVKGAWIIGTGILFFTVFILTAVIISVLNNSEITIESSNLIGQIVTVSILLTIISIPVSMSIYLAWNFSNINKNLTLQLKQVQILSQKNIEQEQEKQRILENKKEELEAEVLERTAELRLEKKKSDDLLLNILPSEIAEELKQKGSAVARDYENVTVMFTDFKDFTKISEQLTPTELVKEIDLCFSAFDHIIQKHGVEKIKTIGDAYMCVGGLPQKSSSHALDVVAAALEIRNFMEQHNLEKAAKGEHQFRIRIGIHTGSVVAGIVGVKKFAYDIWGDTVNIASRIESSGEPGKVNISGSTFEFVKEHFTCIYRGKIEAKNKGQIDMYFVE